MFLFYAPVFAKLNMISSIHEIITDLQNGKPVIVFDGASRENEGDIIVAGIHTTPDIINFMARFGRGLICAALDTTVSERLDLSLLSSNSADQFKTAWTMPVDAVGISTGISAADRSLTMKTLSDTEKTATDFIWPGHVPTLRARSGGVMERSGHTESAIDLMKLAGLPLVATICEIMKDDGTMARLKDLEKFSDEHGLRLCQIEDIKKFISVK